MKKKFGFTLIELLISMVIIGILFVVILKTYSFISQIAFRIEQEKNVNQELLGLSQTIQNFADRNTIDYDKYESKEIFNNSGIVKILYLSGEDGNIKLFSSGDCINVNEKPIFLKGKKCGIFIQQDGKTFELTDGNKVYLTQTLFKIIPFASNDNYLNDEGNKLCEEGNYRKCINKPGFWIITQAYNINYGNIRATKINIPFAQFF